MRPALLAARLKRGPAEASLPAVGDEVEVEDGETDELRVIAVRPRRTALARAGDRAHGRRAVAVNAEQAVIVSSAASPPFRPGLVDRWALLAHRGGMTPFLCVNKIDLTDRDEAERAVGEAAIPLPHVFVSARTGEGLDRLRTQLTARISVLVGHSGVGKSSLLRLLVPEEEIVTGDLSRKSGKGRHTTTSARLYPLPEGGCVIDTPGVRSVPLGKATCAEVAALFPEVRDAPPCRFDSCTHRVEPGCSVLEGVESGSVPEHVYARYRKLLLEADLP